MKDLADFFVRAYSDDIEVLLRSAGPPNWVFRALCNHIIKAHRRAAVMRNPFA